MKILDQLKPTKQPVAYAFLLVVLYQLFVKGDSIPEAWLQYVVEFVASGAAWGLVKPTAKLNENQPKDDANATPDV